MDFASIDQRRRRAGVSQAELCRAASVDPTTYVRLKKEPGSGQVATLQRLTAAVTALKLLAPSKRGWRQRRERRA